MTRRSLSGFHRAKPKETQKTHAPYGTGISNNIKRENGAPGAIRTPDPQIRSLMLYPAELRVRVGDALLGGGSDGRNPFFRYFSANFTLRQLSRQRMATRLLAQPVNHRQFCGSVEQNALKNDAFFPRNPNDIRGIWP